MSKERVRKNDVVVAISGANAGKSGKVLQVLPTTGRAIVEGVNLVKKCMRKSQDNPQGGIADKEAAISLSNLMLYCSSCKKGVRISRIRDGGQSVRKCKNCGHAFEG